MKVGMWLCLLSLAGTAPALVRADALDDDLAGAKNLLISGKEDEAAAKLDTLEAQARRVAAANLQDAHANYILGIAAMYGGHDSVARSALDAALRLEPNNSTYVLGRAQLLLFQDRADEAAKFIQVVLDSDSKNVSALEMMGDARKSAGQLAEAQKNYQQAADLTPGSAGAKYLGMVAGILVDQHKEEDALAVFQKALAADAGLTSALLSMGQIEERRGDHEKALAAFSKVAGQQPDNWRVRAQQVQVCEAMGDARRRDAARTEVLALRQAGKVDADSFCREQFASGASRVMAFEYFDLTGPKSPRFAFNVVGPDGKTIERRISVDWDQAGENKARESGAIKPGEHLFELNAYVPDGHEMLGTLKSEPTYEAAREAALKYLASAGGGAGADGGGGGGKAK